MSLNQFYGVYRKHYGKQHVLICLLEEQRVNLDQNIIIGAVLIYLSKAFGCILYDLLIAKWNTCGYLKFICSYRKGCKQSLCINNTYSDFLQSYLGVSQGSSLVSLLFNVFPNDLLLFIKLHYIAVHMTTHGAYFLRMLHC